MQPDMSNDAAGAVAVAPAAGHALVGTGLAGPGLAGTELAGTELAGPQLAGPQLAGTGLAVMRGPASGLPLADIGRGVRQMIWEVLVLTSGRVAERRDRRRLACHVRQISMYVCHVALRMPQVDIGQAFGRDRSTVSHACHVVEDRRDDPVFDEFVSAIERMAVAAFGQRVSVLHD